MHFAAWWGRLTMDSPGLAPTTSLLGIDFSNITEEAAVRRVLARPVAARFGYVVAPNADHIDRLMRIPRLQAVYRRAMLCLLSSQMVATAAGLFGLEHPGVVTGARLTTALLPHLAGMRVAVVGMKDKDFARVRACYPLVEFVHHEPPMALLDNDEAFGEAVAFVCRARAAFTFFAVDSPVQELLAFSVAMRPEAVGIGLCVGAALEQAVGVQETAPRWMSEHGLEWLHLRGLEPMRRVGRYMLADPRVLVALGVAAIRQKIH
ncbi:WecB/TagA/CpsF family glycosyltransferase [Acidocella sp.]|uniref:WecB/TagA/CpsF family glycosyltransferase n=1 Tax=Acidocella sp. TaxID=50710 RepID=UPI00261DEC66|nr:WecB/TagA/CpsF family glycosyltransferase [Acidocella sp.]